jgi:hypothetical protein
MVARYGRILQVSEHPMNISHEFEPQPAAHMIAGQNAYTDTIVTVVGHGHGERS